MPRQRKPNDLSRSLIPLDLDTTLIAVVELSLEPAERCCVLESDKLREAIRERR
jgi:hypothetical protein